MNHGHAATADPFEDLVASDFPRLTHPCGGP
jgi:hypothetical protein